MRNALFLVGVWPPLITNGQFLIWSALPLIGKSLFLIRVWLSLITKSHSPLPMNGPSDGPNASATGSWGHRENL